MLQAQSECGDIYKWKSKFGGMEVPEAQWLKGLEDENAKLDNAALECRLKPGKPAAVDQDNPALVRRMPSIQVERATDAHRTEPLMARPEVSI